MIALNSIIANNLGIAFWSAWVEANEQQFAEVFCQRVNKTHKCILFEINQIYIINIILGTTIHLHKTMQMHKWT